MNLKSVINYVWKIGESYKCQFDCHGERDFLGCLTCELTNNVGKSIEFFIPITSSQEEIKKIFDESYKLIA